MARSKREIPHYYLGTDIDFLRARSWLDQANGLRPVSARLLPVVLPIKAVALACGDTPDMNGFFTDDRFRASAGVHVGVAISLRSGGLVAPAIHDADGKVLDELMAELRDLVTRARTGRLRSSEMSDPTITVPNLGALGVRTVYGVIYPPQVALVGFGRITEWVWVEDSMIGVRPLVSTTLGADHRARHRLDGLPQLRHRPRRGDGGRDPRTGLRAACDARRLRSLPRGPREHRRALTRVWSPEPDSAEVTVAQLRAQSPCRT